MKKVEKEGTGERSSLLDWDRDREGKIKQVASCSAT